MKKVSFILLIIFELLCAAFSLGQIYFWLERSSMFFVALAVYLVALLFLLARQHVQKMEDEPISRKVTVMAFCLLLALPSIIVLSISALLFFTYVGFH